MKFVLLINLKLLTIANSFLLNIAEHEKFSANKYGMLTIVGIFRFRGRGNFMFILFTMKKNFYLLFDTYNLKDSVR